MSRPFLIICLSLSIAGVALAEPASLSETAIQDRIQQGIALRRAGKDAEALALFLDLEKRAPESVRVLLHVTAAAHANGKWLLAYEYLQKASNFQQDAYYQRHRSEIKAMEDLVLQHVGQLRVMGSPDGAEVVLNGEPVGTLPMKAARVLEVGSYELTVRKPGYYLLQRPVTISGGATLTQEAVELRELDRTSEPTLTTARDAQRVPQKVPMSGPAPAPRRWLTWTLAGVGVVGAATGAVALAVHENEASHWNSDSRCLSGTQSREETCGSVRDRAELAQKVAIVGAGVGATFGAAALVHWLATSTSSSEKDHAQRGVTCDPSWLSLQCHGSF